MQSIGRSLAAVIEAMQITDPCTATISGIVAKWGCAHNGWS